MPADREPWDDARAAAALLTCPSRSGPPHRRALGLPLSEGIIETHGGRLVAASEGPGFGAERTVELRTVGRPAALTRLDRSAKQRSVAIAMILLVEDNEDSANAIAELLRLHGYSVTVADSVEQALCLADQADVLISDIALPDGTGHELMRQISARRPIPGIALSGYSTSEDLRRSTDAGFERHLVKPVDPQLLLDAIEQLHPTRA
jgi:CheY-like chemotaxis protein